MRLVHIPRDKVNIHPIISIYKINDFHVFQ